MNKTTIFGENYFLTSNYTLEFASLAEQGELLDEMYGEKVTSVITEGFVDKIKSAFKAVIDWIKKTWIKIVNWFKEVFGKIKAKFVKKAADKTVTKDGKQTTVSAAILALPSNIDTSNNATVTIYKNITEITHDVGDGYGRIIATARKAGSYLEKTYGVYMEKIDKYIRHPESIPDDDAAIAEIPENFFKDANDSIDEMVSSLKEYRGKIESAFASESVEVTTGNIKNIINNYKLALDNDAKLNNIQKAASDIHKEVDDDIAEGEKFMNSLKGDIGDVDAKIRSAYNSTISIFNKFLNFSRGCTSITSTICSKINKYYSDLGHTQYVLAGLAGVKLAA